MCALIIEKGSKSSTDESDNLIFQKTSELFFLDMMLLIEWEGTFCGWNEIKLKKGDTEVYKIVREEGSEKREEYFFDELKRVSFGNQFSFLEYIATIADKGLIPSAEEFVQKSLDPEFEQLYRDNFMGLGMYELKSPSSY